MRVKRIDTQNARAASESGANPIHPDFLGYRMGEVLAKNTTVVSENFMAADHLMPFGFAQDEWRLVRAYGGSLGYAVGAAVGCSIS